MADSTSTPDETTFVRWQAERFEGFPLPRLRGAFWPQLRALTRIHHPNVVRLHGVLTNGESLLATIEEPTDGELLEHRIAKAPLPVDETLRFGRAICAGLAAFHAQGLVHRELRTDTILLTRAGDAKLASFGLAARLAEDLIDEGSTADGSTAGTPKAMTPEQTAGRTLDHRADLFCLGTVLYEALTGIYPFSGGPSIVDTLRRIAAAPHAPLASHRGDIAPAVSDTIDNLLQKHPGKRPQDADAVAENLGELLQSAT